MRLTFIGAAHEVTGSMNLVELGGRYIMVDCGMEQGKNVYENAPLEVDPSKIEAMVLTHAHVDHSGNIPLLYRKGFRGNIYTTPDTKKLCEIMLRDCAHIKETEAEYASRKAQRAGRREVEPEYGMQDAEGALELFYPVEYGEICPIFEGAQVRFTDVGHLLGSAAAELFLTEGNESRKVVFSGDVGNIDQPIIKDPQTVDGADYLVIESTYGARIHQYASDADPVRTLADVIQRTLDRGGNVIIPSFAVGRTQDILYYIRQIKSEGLVRNHDGFEVYVDSPLSVQATEIFMECSRSCLDEEALELLDAGINPIIFDGLRTTQSVDESKALNTDPVPKVIISSAGMCDAGRIRHHLKHNLWNQASTVLFVGYQSVGTLGRRIEDGADSVTLFGESIAVNCEIAMLPAVSGHADSPHLVQWVKDIGQMPQRIFINHGDDENSSALRKRLTEEGYRAYVPYSGTVYDLLKDAFVSAPEGVALENETITVSSDRTTIDLIRQAISRLSSLVSRMSNFRDSTLRGYLQKLTEIIEDAEKR
ncbi:MAG: MBL fold metallo-hydrolase [Eubacteriaceae bacterium]|nr:MBL fold metallo-hydrolase [Eubacteriaceae bacterium]